MRLRVAAVSRETSDLPVGIAESLHQPPPLRLSLTIFCVIQPELTLHLCNGAGETGWWYGVQYNFIKRSNAAAHSIQLPKHHGPAPVLGPSWTAAFSSPSPKELFVPPWWISFHQKSRWLHLVSGSYHWEPKLYTTIPHPRVDCSKFPGLHTEPTGLCSSFIKSMEFRRFSFTPCHFPARDLIGCDGHRASEWRHSFSDVMLWCKIKILAWFWAEQSLTDYFHLLHFAELFGCRLKCHV